MYVEYGDVYAMSIMGEDELIVSNPLVFDAVVRKEGKFPIGASEMVTTFSDYYRENNITMGVKSISRGPEWKEWRSPLEADLYAGWKNFLPTIADTSRKISSVAKYEVCDARNIHFVDFVSRAAFDLFSSVMYGVSPQTTDSSAADERDVEFVKAAQKAFDLTGKLITNPMEKAFEGDIYKEFKENMDTTFGVGYERTKEFVDKARSLQQAEESGAVEDVPYFMEAADGSYSSESKCPVQGLKKTVKTSFLNPSYVEKLASRGQLTDDEISESTAPLLMAGVDTTAYVLSWLFLNLASNPDVQSKLANELKTVLNGADVTTLEQMNSLPYLKACVRESNRLTPPNCVLTKKVEDDVDLEVNGKIYKLPAGQRISLNMRAYPMDPRFVDSPDEYRPERFLRDAVEARRGTPKGIIDHPSFADPFGRGKRRCLGSNVAMAEIEILTARMVQDYEITLEDPDAMWKPKLKLMLKADPYPNMKLVPRDASKDNAFPYL